MTLWCLNTSAQSSRHFELAILSKCTHFKRSVSVGVSRAACISLASCGCTVCTKAHIIRYQSNLGRLLISLLTQQAQQQITKASTSSRG
jgi:hypothetical protein